MSLKSVKKGKDGTITFLTKRKKDVVTKTFRSNKNKDDIKNEIDMMKKSQKLGISPIVYSSNIKTEKPFIVMEQLGKTLFEYMKKTGKLSLRHQKQIISILEKLDENRIFHGDISPLNFMTGKDDPSQLYIIDFGMAKKMDDAFIKKHGKNANVKLGITVFILKIREQLESFEPVLLLKKVHSLLKL
jgi:tRNA A-37 threonylcarbamoyl transferase component Bud32